MLRHGHVVPNPNGLVARCGGPALCSHCRLEERVELARIAGEQVEMQAVQIEMLLYQVESAAEWGMKEGRLQALNAIDLGNRYINEADMKRSFAEGLRTGLMEARRAIERLGTARS